MGPSAGRAIELVVLEKALWRPASLLVDKIRRLVPALGVRSGWKPVLRSRLLAGRHVRIIAVKKRRRQMSPAAHSITSSARPSRESGTVSPSALVVSGLINSTFVDSWTGRSAGFSRWRREIEVDPEPGLRYAAAAECRNPLSDRRPYPSPAHTASSTSSDIAFLTV